MTEPDDRDEDADRGARVDAAGNAIHRMLERWRAVLERLRNE